jgi:multiple sugar transport system ATP-binding protein
MARVLYENMTKAFDDTLAVNNLYLDIADGEFLVLVGPSGCGKSTALRCLAGLEEITSGDIWIGDNIVTDMLPRERDIAMVFQNYALYPHMSVYDNLTFGLKLRHFAKDEVRERAARIASMLGLEGLMDRKPKQLSGGQRQRVALGRAIIREPQAFLMDEPLSNLDAKLRVQMRAEIVKLQKQLNTTTIYVTHDQVEAMTMGDRIAVMNHGVLQQLDTPQTLYDQPANLFVATFLGSPAMNIIQMRVQKDAESITVTQDPVSFDIPPSRVPQLAEFDGRDVYLGIRPEDFTLASEAPPDWAQVSLNVELVELLGAEKLLHLRGPGESPLLATVDSKSKVSRGDTVKMAINTQHIHAFDMESEHSILSTEAVPA